MLVSLALIGGCATSRRDRRWFEVEVQDRLGASTPTNGTDDGGVVVALDDDAVIARVLGFNPQLRAELTRIDSARATLAEASRPTNPQLSVLGGFGAISTMASLVALLESLWLLPLRSRLAAVDVDITGETVLLRALEFVRDGRVAVVDLRAALARAAIRTSLRATAAELARFAADIARVQRLGARLQLLVERLLILATPAALSSPRSSTYETSSKTSSPPSPSTTAPASCSTSTLPSCAATRCCRARCWATALATPCSMPTTSSSTLPRTTTSRPSSCTMTAPASPPPTASRPCPLRSDR